jgi:prepilin-type N-terminal cleavage/methylation domain-containing protein
MASSSMTTVFVGKKALSINRLMSIFSPLDAALVSPANIYLQLLQLQKIILPVLAGHEMNNRGFTLIEIVIVIIVLGIIGTFTMSFLIDNSKTYQMMKLQRELYQDGVYAMERLSRDITDARGGADVTICPGFWRTHTTARDANLCVIYSWDSVTGTLQRNGLLIARNVSNFSQPINYESQSPPYNISITLQKDCGMLPDQYGNPQRCSVSLSTTMYPRNYCGGNINIAYPPDPPCNSNDYSGNRFNGDYKIVVNE